MSVRGEKLYPYLPIALQNVVCMIYGLRQRRLRYGGQFRQLLDWLQESEWWPAERIERYQDEQLRKIVSHAYQTVPYYRRVFDERGLTPADIRTVADLQKLPVTTKEDVRNYRDEMVSQQFRGGRLELMHTSGTTGKSLKFWVEPRAIRFRWAVWWRHKAGFGIRFGAPYATFTGLTAVPLGQERPPFWRENRPMHQTVFSMHHVVRSKVAAIVQRLNQGGFDYYTGYPSILFVLADLIREGGLTVTAPPKMIFTGAETLYENQRELISEVLGAPVTDLYGFSEGCGNASRCQEDVLHEDVEFGILECEDLQPVGQGAVRGRIIATGLAAYGMPLLRYDVGDVGVWSSARCPCGRASKTLTSIEGRVEDYVVTPEGRRIRRFDYVFKDTRNVKEAQVEQREMGSVCLRVVRRAAYSAQDEEFIKQQIAQKVSPRLRVTFEYVEEIEREPGGKFQAVKSFL